MITESRIQYEEILVVLTLISFVLLGSVALAGPPGPGYWAGKLYIFHEDSLDRLTEVETAKTEFGAKTMNLDPKTDNLCLTTADFASPGASTKKHPHAKRAPIPRIVSRVDL